MVAVQVFPFHHPAIDFLLLLAVAIPYGGRLVVDFLLGEAKRRLAARWSRC